MTRWETPEELEEFSIKTQYFELEERRMEVARREQAAATRLALEAAKRDKQLAQREDAMHYFTELVKVGHGCALRANKTTLLAGGIE